MGHLVWTRTEWKHHLHRRELLQEQGRPDLEMVPRRLYQENHRHHLSRHCHSYKCHCHPHCHLRECIQHQKYRHHQSRPADPPAHDHVNQQR